MNHIKQTTVATKKFVAKHKTAITVVVTAVATATLVIKTRENVIEQHNDFLRANGLYDAFYATLED